MNESGRRGEVLRRREYDVISCCLEEIGWLFAASWAKGGRCDGWMLALVDEDRSCLKMVLRLWSVFIFAILEGCKRKITVEECQYFAENVRHRLILHQSVKLRLATRLLCGAFRNAFYRLTSPSVCGRQHPTLHGLSILNLALFRIIMRLLCHTFHVPEGSR